MARLGDYIEQIRGVSYKPEDVCASTNSEAVAILRANNIQDDGLIFDDLVYVKIDKVSIKQYIQKGDVVICASSGSKNLVGKAATATENLPMAFGAFCKVVRPKKLMPRYIGYFFQSPKYRSTISELSGGANINNIRNEHIDELDIAIVSEEEQERIINELDTLSNLISLRKQQLAKLDELVKSRFIERFDVQKCQKKTLGECTDFVDYRGHTPELSDAGTIRMVNAKSVGKGFFKYVDEYVTEETYDSWMHRGFGHPGDILFVTEGHTFGNTCLIPNDLKKFALGQRVITIKGHQEVLNAFLCSYMQTDMFWKDINVYRTGGTAQGIRSKDLVKVYVPIPPLEQQKQFAAFVEQTDKSKLAIQKSLEKLETLKKALMQKYFG